MAQYITLMRKQDFSDLYKYGIFHANRDCIAEFTGNINSVVRENDNFFNNLTLFSNPFDSSFAYLFIQYDKTDADSRVADIMIEDVKGLYPMDQEAKILLEEDFGPSVKFSEPLWRNGVKKLKELLTLNDCKKGSRNIFKILGLTEEIYRQCQELIPESIFKEVLREVSDNERPEGKLSPWVYILRYERHAIYPKTSLGYCMDAVHALINYSQGREFFSIEASNIYPYLDNQEYNLKLNEYISDINKSETTRPFANFVNQIIPDCNILMIASLYYIMLDRYRDGLRNDDHLEKCLKFWPKELPVAVYMLGWMLGHTKTFECLYEKLGLKFTRKKIEVKEPVFESGFVAEDIPSREMATELMVVHEKPIHKEPAKQTDLFGEQTPPPMQIKMGKLKAKPKHPKDIRKSPKPIIVTTKAELEKRLKDDWVIID